MSVTFSSTRTIKLPMGEQTARLPTIIHCYLLMHCLKDGPVAMVIMANVVANVANLMSGAIVLHMEKLAIGAKASIISKLSVVPRLQPRWDRALTKARSHSRLDMVPRGATISRAKEVATVNTRRGRPQRRQRKQNAYAVTMKNSVQSEVTTTSGGEREKQGNVSSRRSFQDRRRKVRTTGFLALQFIVKCLKAPTLRVSPWRGCILTPIQTIGLRSSQT